MSRIEGAIAALAPAWALRRERARLRLNSTRRARMAYDAARGDHRSDGWRPASSSANREIANGGGRLRSIARDLDRNNPFARRAKRGIVNNVIGTGIIPNAKSVRRGRKRAVGDLEAAMKRHHDTTDIDAAGLLNLYGIQRLVLATVVVAGEALVVRHRRPASMGLALPFQIRVLEPEFLDETKDGPIAGGGYRIQGIEHDSRGRRTGFWLYERHPAEGWATPKSTFYPAADVAHIFDIERPGQARGVSWFAAVMTRLADLGQFADAQLVRQKVAACFVGFEEEPLDDDGPDRAQAGIRAPDDGEGYDIEGFEPGIIQRVRPGRKMTFSSPPQVGDYESALRAYLREIAAGLSITYEVLTGDLSQTNFSTGRMGWLEFWRSICDWQENMLRPMLLDVIGRWTLDAARLRLGTPEGIEIGWTPPRREMINPREEIQAARDAIRAGLSSRSHEQRKQGFDPDDLDTEIADDNERADEMGLAFDSDGRRPVNGQGAGSAGQIAHAEGAPPDGDGNGGAAEGDKDQENSDDASAD